MMFRGGEPILYALKNETILIRQFNRGPHCLRQTYYKELFVPQ